MQKMTPKAYQFLNVLAASQTVKAAIDETGVAQSTAYKWMRDPLFKEKLREARRTAMLAATSKLSEASEEAVDLLRKVMADDDSPTSSRVSAARCVLEMGYNAVQADDLAERLEVLETGRPGDDTG